MSDGLKSWIKLLTSWILTAFSAIAPKWTGARMGTVSMGAMAGVFNPSFSPTSEKFFFFSSLYPLYFILQSASALSPLYRTHLLPSEAYLLS